MEIIKRSGKVVPYDGEKVRKAISKAMIEVEGFVDEKLIDSIDFGVAELVDSGRIKHVEDIQDFIELELMTEYPKIAKAYILYRHEREKLRTTGWELNELQTDIYENKYKHEDEEFPEFIERVSGGNEVVGKMIRDKEFLFAGRILAGRGLDRNVTLSNCYVLPSPEDNLESIFDVAKMAARTYSYGGGVGFDISRLRAEGEKVNNAALTTSGPVSFMDLYDVTTAVIGQKGRRGALMLSMDVNHPDINKFILSKEDVGKINHANISVRVDDEFMYNLHKDESNMEIFQLLARKNWEVAEPGVLFQGRIDKWHLLSEHPEYELFSTNPCGEQPLPACGSCNLGSINLSEFVIDPYTDEARIDYNGLKRAVMYGIIGLNEVLDEGMNKHPLQIQRDMAARFRQVGLGIMGLADMFIKLGITYGSDESIELSEVLGNTIRNKAIETSVELAKVYGPYPAYDFEYISKSSYFKNLPEYLQELIKDYGMRNSHVLSIAPTGSISTMLGVSGGIEPIFANSFMRTTKSLAGDGDVKYKVFTETIAELMEVKGIKDEKDLPNYCVTSHDIDPMRRILIQSMWQSYVDSAISSTINLHEDTTVDEVADIYFNAWRHGLKGVTIFRDNCFRTGILEVEDDEPSKFECPECGEDLNMAEGCNSCPSCGWGQCSI